jgi:ABC-type molybdate transport system substrate-binding protein
MAAAPLGAVAAQGHRDIGVFADLPLRAAMAAAGSHYSNADPGAVAVLASPAPLILAQIAHNPSADILVLPPAFMDEAVRREFIDTASRRDNWRTAIVLAGRAGEAASAGQDLKALLAGASLAVTDATVASTLDGQAIATRLGIGGVAGKIIGVANTDDAAFMLRRGDVRFAILLATDLATNPDLKQVAPLPGIEPMAYAFALSRRPPSRNAHAFYDFLNTSDGQVALQRAGLEIAA